MFFFLIIRRDVNKKPAECLWYDYSIYISEKKL